MEKTIINPDIFRAYDIRGVYPDDLNSQTAYLIAQAYAELYPELKNLVVCMDVRESSIFIKQGILRGLLEKKCQITDIGCLPVPLMYFTICHYKKHGGIMITGSHNPKQYNGLKMQTKQAEPVITADLERIKDLALQQAKAHAQQALTCAGACSACPWGGANSAMGGITSMKPIFPYLEYVAKKIFIKKPLKIVIDVGNGTVGKIAEKLFKKLGCHQTKTLYSEPDPDFPHHLPDPYEPQNLRDLQKAVKKEKADLGLAFDGDGDRVGLVDAKGRIIGGDLVLMLLALDAVSRRKGPIVHEVRTSQAFIDKMRESGCATHFTVAHHKAILDKIKQTKAVFGGETTGHLYFPLQYYLYDDAIFAAAKIVEIASKQADFSAYIDSLPRYHASPEIFIDSTDEEKVVKIKKLQAYLRKNKYAFIDVDGARIQFDNGWALARYANTTPIIKVRFEGRTEKDLQQVKKRGIEIFRKVGISV